MVCAFRATLVVNRQLVAAASRRAASMTTTTTTVVVAHIPMVGAKCTFFSARAILRVCVCVRARLPLANRK
jgi:hypothetical protein